MSLKWTGVLETATQLDESRPEVDPRYVSFIDLRRRATEPLELFDDPQRSGEKVLGAIQTAWIEEQDQPQARLTHLPGIRVQFAGFILGEA